jgi:opacity protein-like surface antigen
MSYRHRVAAAALAALFAASPLAAQTKRSFVVGAYGGRYDHLLNLDAAGTADFTPGYSLGATAGVQLNRYVAVHGDFTFARNEARGDASFAGRSFDRFFYGAHVELGYPLADAVTPYAFLGGGAVRVREPDGSATISPFTKPAAMFGLGFFYALRGTPVELFGEAKDLVYKWDRGGFDHMQWDFTYTAGLTYRFAW